MAHHKKIKPCFPFDYCQISLVRCAGKVYEGILRDALLQGTTIKITATQQDQQLNHYSPDLQAPAVV